MFIIDLLISVYLVSHPIRHGSYTFQRGQVGLTACSSVYLCHCIYDVALKSMVRQHTKQFKTQQTTHYSICEPSDLYNDRKLWYPSMCRSNCLLKGLVKHQWNSRPTVYKKIGRKPVLQHPWQWQIFALQF